MHSLTFRGINHDIGNTALQDDCRGTLSLKIDIGTAVIEDDLALDLGGSLEGWETVNIRTL